MSSRILSGIGATAGLKMAVGRFEGQEQQMRGNVGRIIKVQIRNQTAKIVREKNKSFEVEVAAVCWLIRIVLPGLTNLR